MADRGSTSPPKSWLQLLRSQPQLTAAYTTCAVVVALAPLITAFALGQVVRALTAGGTEWPAIAVLALASSAFALATALSGPLGVRLARTLEGAVRASLLDALRGVATPLTQEQRELIEASFDFDEGRGNSIGYGALAWVRDRTTTLGLVIGSGALTAYHPIAGIAVGLGAFTLRRALTSRLRTMWAEDRDAVQAHARDAYLLDSVTTPGPAREVRVFDLGKWLVDRHRIELGTHVAHVERRRIQVARKEAWLLPVGIAIAAAGFGIPAAATLNGDLSQSSLATCVLLVTSVLAMTHVGQEQYFRVPGGQMFAAARAALQQLDRDHSCPPSPPVATGPTGPILVLADVHFGYTPGSPVIQGLNMVVNPGDRLALVGVNGAGKSTLARLMAGLLRPDSGSVQAGTDNSVSIVFQDFVRYPFSLLDNVRIAFPSATDHAVAGVIESSGLSHLVASLPNGIHTSLSADVDGGVDLSGGQWRRLAIARALLAERSGARLIIFDEPTADLDGDGEFDFFNTAIASLDSAAALVISHRMSTVRMAQTILVLSGGRIAETGTHLELRERGGVYATFYDTQAAAFRGNEAAAP